MRTIHHLHRLAAALGLALLTGCSSMKLPAPRDYTAYQENMPGSILVLPPVNQSTDTDASDSVLTHVTVPLAEAGYYVTPVALVTETMRHNGVTEPAEIHALPHERLQTIFGADAALYLTITEYGTRFLVLNSLTQVSLKAELVDLRSGQSLWSGTAAANSDEGSNSSGGAGLIGLLALAIAKQVIASASDADHDIAQKATQRLLSTSYNGILPGPRAAQPTPE